MADIEAIRQGLAALLRPVLPANEGHISPYFAETPPVPTLQVAAIESATRIDYGDGLDIRVLIEAFVGTVTDIGAQKRLDALVGSSAVSAAVESDESSAGALFSRLNETGTLTTGLPAAADSVALVAYRGQARVQRNGVDYLTGVWEIQVVA